MTFEFSIGRNERGQLVIKWSVDWSGFLRRVKEFLS